jgi:HAD superfamily hydrolase (TIGR01509 family)
VDRAFIFDMDGVLVDSTALHTQAWLTYLERHGVRANGVLQRMHGKRNDEIVTDLFSPELTPEEIFEHGAAKERLYRELMAPVLEQHLVRGVRIFLEKTGGMPRAVASNAEPENIDFVLERSGLRAHFSVLVDGHQVARPKPHPDIYLRAAALLKISPANCIVFEDSAGGVRAAREAGARVVGIETTLSPVPDVDLSIPDFNDQRLIEWLQKQ